MGISVGASFGVGLDGWIWMGARCSWARVRENLEAVAVVHELTETNWGLYAQGPVPLTLVLDGA